MSWVREMVTSRYRDVTLNAPDGRSIVVGELDLFTPGYRPTAALRRWAKANGFESREGGWIYYTASGKPCVQGWRSLVHVKFYELLKDPELLEVAMSNAMKRKGRA